MQDWGTCDESHYYKQEGRRVMNRTPTKKKMAFSLMRLIAILVLAFITSSAMAQNEFKVNIEGPTSVSYTLNATGDAATAEVVVDVIVTAAQLMPILVYAPEPGALINNLDFTLRDKDGFQPSQVNYSLFDVTDYAMRTGKVRKVRVVLDESNFPELTKVILTVEALETPDPTVPKEKNAHKSKAVHHTITFTALPAYDLDRPRVVSIQRLRPSSQAVVSAFEERQIAPEPFDVRIVLTEARNGIDVSKPGDFVLVDGGTASNLVIGVPFTMLRTDATDAATTYRPHPIEGMYEHTLAGVPLGVTGSGNIPAPTGDDEMYHQYRVTIAPYRRVDMVKISVKEFNDGGSPFLNIYKPFNVDYKPNGREQLRLAVATPTMPPETGVMISLPHDDDVKITEKQKADATAADAVETVAAEKVKAEAATVAVKKAVDTSVRIPEDGEIYISEIMFAKSGILPQWIEITNGSRTEQVNLSGWTLMVENDATDADVSVGARAKFTIPEGTRIDPSGQNDTPSTILVVTEQGRNNLTGAMADGQVVNLWTEQQLELFRLDIFKRRYSLLSDMAFKITLAPPAALITPPAAVDATDVVGNLGADGVATWVLPMAEGHARSSILRRHVAGSVGPAEPKDGEMMESWALASDTNFGKPMHLSVHSYYGLPIDVGTPGFRAGGALPVELSHFRPARDKATGAAVITWSTQSELNNAGFFIKRSRRRDEQFKVINATMIPGAGTTGEKQFYTYTDTTAQLNVVYYYQIEDVSLDGDRQTLTRGVRLRGHVGAAGKATTTWGELKRVE